MNKFSKLIIGLVAVLIGVLIHQCLIDDTKVNKANNVTTTDNNYVYDIDETYYKGKVYDDYDITSYCNFYFDMTIDIPENYSEVEQNAYDRLKAETGDEYGMYFIDQNSNSIIVGFKNLSSYGDISAEYYLKNALEESVKVLYEQGYEFSGLISDSIIADKIFKKGVLVSSSLNGAISMYAYKKNKIMCYITVTGDSAYRNDLLVSNFMKTQDFIDAYGYHE